MATATVQEVGVQFTLVLNEAEAKYVAAALGRTDPASHLELDGDPVHDALTDAMCAQGVDYTIDDSLSY